MILGGNDFALYKVAIDQIIVVYATEVHVTVSFINLFAGDTNIVQSLSGSGVTEHLLEKQKLTGVVATHHHLVVGKGLAERMGRHPITKTEVTSDTF